MKPLRLRDCRIGDREFRLPIMVWARLTVDHPKPYTSGEDIVSRGAVELLKIKNIGRKKLLIIRDALRDHGLTLDVPPEYEPRQTLERERRLFAIRKFNASVRRRAKERGL